MFQLIVEESEEKRESVFPEEKFEEKDVPARDRQIYALRNVGLKPLISGRKNVTKGYCDRIFWGNKYARVFICLLFHCAETTPTCK